MIWCDRLSWNFRWEVIYFIYFWCLLFGKNINPGPESLIKTIPSKVKLILESEQWLINEPITNQLQNKRYIRWCFFSQLPFITSNWFAIRVVPFQRTWTVHFDILPSLSDCRSKSGPLWDDIRTPKVINLLIIIYSLIHMGLIDWLVGESRLNSNRFNSPGLTLKPFLWLYVCVTNDQSEFVEVNLHYPNLSHWNERNRFWLSAHNM